ncbi:hypothetical protein H5410_056770 [Solanum commersonii]|uniref:Uncharacterized protein n=1 Tax=Solanum commersonii TaxID=4109 RepID=A0A9J5WN83_SOLCO|nr:hypothetical protein H5410_056770 [Solanum commersonii]
MSSQTCSHTSKRSRNSTSLTQRTWTAVEEQTLIGGVKELCINGWRNDNGTFRLGCLKELECYLHKHHPTADCKVNHMSYLKQDIGRNVMRVDPNAKNMDTKKWPMLMDWEEFFWRDRATGEFAKGPLDAVEEIQRS